MKKLFSIIIVCAVAGSAIAIPARRDGMVRTNAEGKQITVFQHGDETFHYMTDGEGNWLDEQTLLPISAEVKAAREQHGEARMQARRARQAADLPRTLAPRGAVILVNFQDKAFSHSHDVLQDWAMGDDYTYNGGTGSIRKYFLDQSWGAYDMQIDIYGPVTVSRNVSYYGSNDSNGDDKHPDEMVKEACILAHDSCDADFSQYDANNDGKVDWVVILYAGKGEADGGAATTVWPHQYELSYTGMAFNLDGKTVDHYCCLNEIDGQSGQLGGIGTFCHEFSHVMGLPDLYATNNATHHTMCEWDILDYGPYNNNGNTPPNYSAYERWFMGWLTPRVLTEPEYVTLNPMVDSHEALLMCEGDAHNLNPLNPDPKTFYLLENRKKTGWDKYLPGKGLLITKIQFSYNKWTQNTVNNTKSSMGVDLIEAKANTTSGRTAKGKSTDAFPAGAEEYTGFAGHEITQIALTNSIVIEFSYRDGVQGVEEIEDGKATTKIIRDGKVLIIRDGKTYDILGNRL